MEKRCARGNGFVQFSGTIILSKMKEQGIGSIIELSSRSGIDQPTLSSLVSGILSFKTKKGVWRKAVTSLSAFFECLPGEFLGIKKKSRARDFHNVRAETCFAHERSDVLLSHAEEIFHPERAVFRSELARRMDDMLAGLTEKEKRAICTCFGFDGKGERTLVEASRELKISRARVDQLKKCAIGKLQRNNKLRLLYTG
ncbi:MAG: hypothetical protein A3B07_02160 [Candidatus Yonathbacteria bacterium RIFCSPLOWO2_01_FULL_43_27]|uniref:RNA polymerase sigma-70 region 4 domain-containing protein n=2 Tax=Parcubacteria group TaxID=1794811 RepID=A0A1G2SC32_9BACT|nr:MAG: RNA polymerase sigma factor [Candidatus Azambacteria bacterium GW2011_GWA1_44_9]OHA78580.1 MAG: hypothetical protein A2658_02215 [Candidatus Yonathbacteria bacterium RIFCSPHIGHO2_01_FULL_44_19]OHA82318.1 MAG: hypothetical protein A3B07_02160 [Candidatus Yonathbacteria bacterium RIFCSPLOWO2_01_FULL_43_27]